MDTMSIARYLLVPDVTKPRNSCLFWHTPVEWQYTRSSASIGRRVATSTATCALKRARSMASTSVNAVVAAVAVAVSAEPAIAGQPDITATVVITSRAGVFMTRIVRRAGGNWYHSRRSLMDLSGECSACKPSRRRRKFRPETLRHRERQIRESPHGVSQRTLESGETLDFQGFFTHRRGAAYRVTPDLSGHKDRGAAGVHIEVCIPAALLFGARGLAHASL